MINMVERLLEGTEKNVINNLSDLYRRIEESVDYYRDTVKCIDMKIDGYDIIEKLEVVRKDMDELRASIRNGSDLVVEALRIKENEVNAVAAAKPKAKSKIKKET
jgi:hypothetical protein